MDNLTLLTDFYEFTMSNGYICQKMQNKIACFDMFFRKVPDDGGFAIMAGVETLVNILKNLKFTVDDINFLKSRELFSSEFINYLENFKFSCDIWSIDEGMPIFPGEPILTVRGPIAQASLIETIILLTINHQSLIATKANRMVRSAENRPVFEFGARRAQGVNAALLGARAAFIGGCTGTSLTLADKEFGIPASGTMAHSWVQSFDNELDAFRSYANIYPNNSTFLVDTYNVLKSGVPNAIKVHNEILAPKGHSLKAIRLDSGDMSYLSIRAREMLDSAGLYDTKIMASNSLDEYLIRDLIMQGAKIDSFGVGERLITSHSEPVFGGVYKLVALSDDNGNLSPTIKISENEGKITTPHFKQVYRLFDKTSGSMLADVITLFDETIVEHKPYTIFHPIHTWKQKTLTNFKAVPLLKPIFISGVCVYKSRDINEIKQSCKNNINTLWKETLRLENPQTYYVDLSEKLWNSKKILLQTKKNI